jgi:hypothetical protein
VDIGAYQSRQPRYIPKGRKNTQPLNPMYPWAVKCSRLDNDFGTCHICGSAMIEGQLTMALHNLVAHDDCVMAIIYAYNDARVDARDLE